MLDEAIEPTGEDVPGDLEPGLEVIEPADTEEGIPDDEEAPPLADDVEAPGDRAVDVLEAGPSHLLMIQVA